MDLQQPLLLAIAVAVPAYLLVSGHTRALLGWICVTLSVQVFDTVTLTNLPAGRVVGLLYLPCAFLSLGQWFKLTVGRAWVINFLYLACLGVLWGFLSPWPDITDSRPFSLAPQGRTIIYLGRLVTDLSLTLFVASELRRPGGVEWLRRCMILGSTLSALGALASVVLNLDLYHAITGLSFDYTWEHVRPRGFSFEPRGLGMVCVYGIFFQIPRARFQLTWLLPLIINLGGLLISGSTSALALFAAGLLTTLLFSSLRERVMLVVVGTLGALLFAGLTMLFFTQFQTIRELILERLDPTTKLGGEQAANFGERVAYQLDVFDGSALLFLLRNPAYAISGTGPGLMSLPASYHVPPGIYSAIWTDEIGIDSLPSHGPLLAVADSGVLGLVLLCVQVGVCAAAMSRLARDRSNRATQDTWRLGRYLFLLGAAFYCVQVGVTPVWAVMCGLGWSAVLIDQQRSLARSSRIPSRATLALPSVPRAGLTA